MLHVSVFLAVIVSVLLGVLLLVMAAAITGQLFHLGDITGRGYLLLAVAGLIHFLVGRYANYRAVGTIGVTRSTPVRSVGAPYTLLMAMLVLGERISVTNGVGIVIVMVAPAIMIPRPAGARRNTSASLPSSNPGDVAGHSTAVSSSEADALPARLLAEGYLFGLIGGLAYGTSPLLIREAIGDTGMGVAGAMIAYSAAAVPLVLAMAWPGRLASLERLDRGAWGWLLMISFTIFFAQMFRFVALDFAPITLVSPLARTGTIFSVMFAFLINRQLEAFGPRVLAAIALSVVGSVFVVL